VIDGGKKQTLKELGDAEIARRDAVFDRMSFLDYSMTAMGLMLEGDYIAGPFEILGRARDPNGDEWSRWIRFSDGDGRQHQVAVKDADLHGDPGALAAMLARHGLTISARHRRQLIDYFNGLDSDQRVRLVARTGWHTIGGRPVFVLPAESLGSPVSETVVLTSSEASPYASRGTLKDGKTALAVCAKVSVSVFSLCRPRSPVPPRCCQPGRRWCPPSRSVERRQDCVVKVGGISIWTAVFPALMAGHCQCAGSNSRTAHRHIACAG
jgi:hypothetical protein